MATRSRAGSIRRTTSAFSLSRRRSRSRAVEKLKAPDPFTPRRIDTPHDERVFAEPQTLAESRTAVVDLEGAIEKQHFEAEEADHGPPAGDEENDPHREEQRGDPTHEDDVEPGRRQRAVRL